MLQVVYFKLDIHNYFKARKQVLQFTEENVRCVCVCIYISLPKWAQEEMQCCSLSVYAQFVHIFIKDMHIQMLDDLWITLK